MHLPSKTREEIIAECSGKTIVSLSTRHERGNELSSNEIKTLSIGFDDGSILSLYDDVQSCCEDRYITIDDDLMTFVGDKFVGITLKDYKEDVGEKRGCHDIQFVDIQTDKGVLQIISHNEHNGCYSGIEIRLALMFKP